MIHEGGLKERDVDHAVAGTNGVGDSHALANGHDLDALETQEWLDSLEAVLYVTGKDRAQYLLSKLGQKAERSGVPTPWGANTPYVNTIPTRDEPPFPGNRDLERRIKSIIRWNAMAMVVQANEVDKTIGGHIGTFASSATLYEIGFNHFFRGPDSACGGDLIYFQGHASPGMYARAYLEGRLSEQHLKNFRRELAPGGGLSSYPHPWLMPAFWQFPTVSMGLGPIMSIYQARFNRYLENRGLRPASDQKVWAFLGDGEMDEPESLGAITLAAREDLDNLIWVINCNLQRLDGPVRGNGKIIQELEAAFRGAGWNCLKVLWGSDWDPLLSADKSGLLVQRMGEVLDGEYMKYVVSDPSYIREHFFGKYPELLELVKDIPDVKLANLKRGGHDPNKVHAAYKSAVEHKGSPTVILVATVKGYGLGEAGEGLNSVHQIKVFKEKKKVLATFRDRFSLPLSDDDVEHARFYKPSPDSPEMKYLLDRRKVLGGSLPQRRVRCPALPAPSDEFVDLYSKGSGKQTPSTTMVFVDILERLMKDTKGGLAKWIVPIVPDEGRTFGMDPLFSKYKIYSAHGQLYSPVDDDTAFPYREGKTGQMLEEGITEAGSMSSFIAAGTAYATHGIPTIPFFIYYSMFGFQRIGDLCWAAADLRCRGFMLGATAGRTTLNGEGLQHEDGHSHLIASTIPNLLCYDPAFAYELAVILQDGIRRMYGPDVKEDVFYYITLYNENHAMPAMPDGAKAGILKGLYKVKPATMASKGAKAHLIGSGPILMQVLRAQEILAGQFGIAADVWSATSYKELRREALAVERWNFLHADQPPRQSWVEEALGREGKGDVFLAASDHMRAVPEMIARWVPGGLFPLGTDGFGRSESREALRRHFEIDAECIALAALYQLSRRGVVKPTTVREAMTKLGIDAEKIDPMRA